MKWFDIKNQADASEVMLYGTIGESWDGEGVSAKAFADAFNAIPKANAITLRIHSPGGSVFDGLAIYHTIKARRDKVTAVVEGVALSAASFIAMAAKEVRMPKTARMMIHDASGLAIGDSKEMRAMADMLDRESDNIANIYAEKTGKPASHFRNLMKETTWLNGDEAKELGLVDTVTDLAPVQNTFDLSQFRRVPAEMGGKTTPANTQTTNTMNTPQNAQAGVTTTPAQNTTTTPTPTATPSNVVNVDLTAEVNRLKAQVDAERTKRLTAALDSVINENPNIDREKWLPRVLNDEAILNDLRALPVPPVPGPVNRIEVIGNSLIEKYRGMSAGADRMKFRVENHSDLQRVSRQIDPKNANTLAGALVPDYVADGLVVILSAKLAPLRAFSRDFSLDRMRPKAVVQVRKATSGSTTQTNASNFESGNTTLAAIAVTTAQLTNSFYLSNDEIQQGHKLQNLVEVASNNLANAISDVWTGIVTTGNYGAATVIGAAANFDSADLPAIWALSKNYDTRHLILDGGHLAYLLPTSRESFAFGESGAYGFDGIFMQNRWTGATANTVGFVCDPKAIAVASGLPLNPGLEGVRSLGIAQVPQLGLAVEMYEWANTSKREHWMSMDIIFGAAAGDTTAAELLATA